MELKIEEFLQMFGQRLSSLSRDAFRSQVRALIQLKQCEEAHLGEEVERHWFEVVTQQYVFTRLSKEVREAHIKTEAVESAHFLDLQLIVSQVGPDSGPVPGPGTGLVSVLVVIGCLVPPAGGGPEADDTGRAAVVVPGTAVQQQEA